ncbi:adenosylcobinamide-GDP ribazoletransferase [Chelativorans salis]|uniref:Adenosylcobinamide-GDP ribazoletransferase n=1 Tax=Chelativorans salis TaxID=2978478 RepID=A0ABT2LT20_9HYPH|nr:adenosylcobinamide-GDP ribazoletransferase [Chelativorans sp. EGI FJ00035]MCT7377677.1 adenosylcobinamide-GDP ribazoletransferase [Chelativorans sp. EGI FJ00035]
MNGEATYARRLVADAMACISFYTRLPFSAAVDSFAAAQWAAPVAGAVVGLVSGAVLWAVLLAGVPATIAAAAAVGAGMLATGALHEDGLADVADGFGGGKTRDEKLTIMRDSRVGSYGVLVLIVSVLARWAALAAIAGMGGAVAVLALVVAHAASRALMPLFMMRVPPARTDGLSAGIGRIERPVAFAALAIGGFFLFLAGPFFALLSAALLAVWFRVLERLCRRQIGGQTGDVLGALQQGGEAAVLITASAILV